MKTVAYYKGCLASLSAKELDISTQALAPKVGLELIELERVTCCGAGDIHEAEPDYYLHLNARILAYGEATGADTLMTICNVCTLNLRQANYQLQNDDALRERVSDNLERVGAPRYSGGVEVKHLLWLIADGVPIDIRALNRVESTHEFSLDVSGTRYVRAELRGHRGRPERGEVVWAMTNPIWIANS